MAKKKQEKEVKTFFGSSAFLKAVKKRKKELEKLSKEFPVSE